jgi:hypothetical protein
MSFTPTGFVDALTQLEAIVAAGETAVVFTPPPHAASAPVAITPPISCDRERESIRCDICNLHDLRRRGMSCVEIAGQNCRRFGLFLPFS